MRKLVLIALAAGCLLTLPTLVAAPTADAATVSVGPNGVSVRDRGSYRERRHWRRHRAEYRGSRYHRRHRNYY